MPAIVIAAIIGAGAAIGTTAYSAHAQGSAADKAARNATDANDAALELERQQEAERKRQWDETQLENRRQYDQASIRDRQLTAETLASRQRSEEREVGIYNNEQTRRQPYRDTSWAAVQALAARQGLTITRTDAPQLQRPPAATSMADLLGY